VLEASEGIMKPKPLLGLNHFTFPNDLFESIVRPDAWKTRLANDPEIILQTLEFFCRRFLSLHGKTFKY
jgi:hypothetical protein